MPAYRNILLTALFLLFLFPLTAQMDFYNNQFEHSKDSLLKELSKHPSKDTSRANILVNLLDCAVFLSQKRQLVSYWEELYDIGRQSGNKRILASCYAWKGSFYKSEQKTDSAFLYFDSVIAISTNTRDTWLNAARGYVQFEKGMIYEFREDFYPALSNYFGALEVYNGSDPRKQKMIALRVADVYKKLRNEDKALEYYKSALHFYELQSNGGRVDNEAEGIYTSIAGVYYNRGDLTQAKQYLGKLTPTMPDTAETLETGGYYHLAGQIALKEKKTDSAIYLLKEAMHYFDFIKEMHIDEIANVSADLASLQLSKQNIEEAKKYATQSLALAKQGGRKETIAAALKVMSDYYHLTGNSTAAYQALHEATQLNDSLLTENNLKQANTLAAVYENNNKEKAIAQLESDKKIQAADVKQKSLLNTIFIITIVGLIAISAMLFLNFRSQRKIERQKIAELEKEKQMTGIEAMLKGEESERSRLAKDLHDGLGGMLSGVRMSFSTMKENMLSNPAIAGTFDKSLQQLDNTIVELRKVAHNLMPDSLVKYGLKSAVTDFCETMQVSGNSRVIYEQFGTERKLGDIADVNIYRIIQELVNNAVIHGKAGQILVQLTIMDKVLITVEDDGKGFNQQVNGKPHGIGLSNIQHRVHYFNGKMDIESQPGEGTTVNIELNA